MWTVERVNWSTEDGAQAAAPRRPHSVTKRSTHGDLERDAYNKLDTLSFPLNLRSHI